MSLANLKDNGNKGNNFPYQYKSLQLSSILVSVNKFSNINETIISNVSSLGLQGAIDTFFTSQPNYYLVSKSIVWDGTNYTAFITYAVL
jgi:hypothetical protein